MQMCISHVTYTPAMDERGAVITSSVRLSNSFMFLVGYEPEENINNKKL